MVIINEDFDITFRKVVEALDALSHEHQWVSNYTLSDLELNVVKSLLNSINFVFPHRFQSIGFTSVLAPIRAIQPAQLMTHRLILEEFFCFSLHKTKNEFV